MDSYRFEIISADVLPDSAALLAPAKGMSIVGIKLAITNTSARVQPVSTFAQLALKLPGGGTGVEVPPDAAIDALKEGALEPGKRVKGYVLYEVPTSALPSLVLELSGDLTENRATIGLDVKRR